jgi:hypothetical protein
VACEVEMSCRVAKGMESPNNSSDTLGFQRHGSNRWLLCGDWLISSLPAPTIRDRIFFNGYLSHSRFISMLSPLFNFGAADFLMLIRVCAWCAPSFLENLSANSTR